MSTIPAGDGAAAAFIPKNEESFDAAADIGWGILRGAAASEEYAATIGPTCPINHVICGTICTGGNGRGNIFVNKCSLVARKYMFGSSASCPIGGHHSDAVVHSSLHRMLKARPRRSNRRG